MQDRTIVQRLEAEVKCLHCSHAAGLLRRELGEAGAPTTFHAGSGRAPVAVGSLSALRCTRCGGSLYTDDYRVVNICQLRLLEKPRRGRPPKRPVELHS